MSPEKMQILGRIKQTIPSAVENMSSLIKEALIKEALIKEAMMLPK